MDHPGGSGGPYRARNAARARAGPYNRHPRDDGRQRPRHSAYEPPKIDEQEEIEARLTTLLLRVGDKSASSQQTPIQQISALSKVLEGDLPRHHAHLRRMLLACASDFPFKLAVYATLAGVLTSRDPQFGRELVESTSGRIENALKECNFRIARNLLSFACELACSCIVELSSLHAMFEHFLECVNNAGNSFSRRQAFAGLLLSAIPHTHSSLPAQLMESVLRDVGALITDRGESKDDFRLLFEAVSESYREPDTVKSEFALIHPQQEFDVLLSDCPRTALPDIEIPPHSASSSYPMPSTSLCMFEKNSAWSMLDLVLIRQGIVDTIDAFEISHKDCVKVLLSSPIPAKLESTVLDVIFSQMMTLPMPPFPLVYYMTLICDLCKVSSEIPPLLGRSINTLFNRLTELTPVLRSRFAEWFGLHLANFDFSWNWDYWDSVLEEEESSARRIFVNEILDRCVRLSYWERICQAIPESFSTLLPPQRAVVFDLAKPEAEGHAEANVLLEAIRAKTPSQQLQVLCTTDEALAQLSVDKRREISLKCLFYLGSKSISHLNAVIDRYRIFLKSLLPTPDARSSAITVAASFWTNSKQNLILLVDKLMSARLISHGDIVGWVLSEPNLSNLQQYHLWEILDNCIRKVLGRVRLVRNEISNHEKRKKENESAGQEADDVGKKLQKALATTQREKKELFLALFERMCNLLEATAEQSNVRERISSMLAQYLRQYADELLLMKSTLETVVFNEVEDETIKERVNDIDRVAAYRVCV